MGSPFREPRRQAGEIMNRFSLSVSAQFEIGQTRPRGLRQLTDELMDLTFESGGRIDNGRHSTQTSYGWRGENLDGKGGLLEERVKELRKANSGLDFILANEDPAKPSS